MSVTRPHVRPAVAPEVARHHAENLLARYCRAGDDRDAVAVGALLQHAEVVFGDQEPVRGQDAVTALYTAAFNGQPTVRHLSSNLIVEPRPDGTGALARARYTRWVIDPDLKPEPVLVGMGDYQLKIRRDVAPEGQRPDDDGWHIVHLRVVRTWVRQQPPPAGPRKAPGPSGQPDLAGT